MEQKRVSFKVAKAIKEAGYPQCGDWWYSENGGLSDDWLPEMMYCAAPTYLDIRLWLWREKGIYIDIAHYYSSDEVTIWDKKYNKIKSIDCFRKYQDPEEAITSAIEYLVDNNLVK